jgi:hypothetical protein
LVEEFRPRNYLVLDDFGRIGPAWRETDDTQADRGTLMRHLLEGQFENPVRIAPFNTAGAGRVMLRTTSLRRARRSAAELGGLSRRARELIGWHSFGYLALW